MITVYSNVPFEAIKYMPLPDSTQADVRLHKNIELITDDDGTYYQADEVYFRASITLEEVEANFDALWDDPPVDVVGTIEQTNPDKLTELEEQLAVLTTTVITLSTELTAVAEAVNLEIVEDGSIKQIVKEPVQLL